MTTANPGLVLERCLDALDEQTPFVAGDSVLEDAVAAGRRYWRRYYGEQLVGLVFQSIASGALAPFVRHGRYLLRLSPSALRVVPRKAAARLTSAATGGDRR